MAHPTSHTDDDLQRLINRFNRGDSSARELLLERACERLRRLTRKILGAYPTVSRWEQTDDIFQQCVLVLYTSLEDVRPQNVRAFMGLAATQIRRKLIDLARKYNGPNGMGKMHATSGGGDSQSSNNELRVEDATSGPLTLQKWTEFHEHVDQLPDDEKEVFDLIYYQGLSITQVALLVEVSDRTVKRRWRSAKLALVKSVGDLVE